MKNIAPPLLAWPADMPASPKIWQLVTWAILAVLLKVLPPWEEEAHVKA